MDDAEKVAEVKRILDKWALSPEQRLRDIQAVLHPPKPASESPTNDRGCPLMQGTAWDRHDDPERDW